MKKDPKDYTKGEAEYYRLKQAVKAGKPNAHAYFRNIAVTVDGDLCIGMTHNTQGGYYSCGAIVADGMRINKALRWDLEGGAMGDFSDLNTKSVSKGVRKI